MLLSLGGDGHFLNCSNYILNNKTAIIGLNTNPSKSFGFLTDCKLPPINQEQYLEDILSQISEQEMINYYRTRFVVESDSTKRKDFPMIGLNEFFMGPLQANTTLVYEFGMGKYLVPDNLDAITKTNKLKNRKREGILEIEWLLDLLGHRVHCLGPIHQQHFLLSVCRDN